jgi:hypothetical protein
VASSVHHPLDAFANDAATASGRDELRVDRRPIWLASPRSSATLSTPSTLSGRSLRRRNTSGVGSGPDSSRTSWNQCLSRKPPAVLREQFGKHSVWFSRRCHPDPALACALNCPLHEPRRLGLFNELAEIGEPSGLALRNRHCKEVGPVAVLNYP